MCFKLSSDTRFINILIIIILQNKHLNDSYMILYIWTIKFVDDPIVGKLGLKWLSFKILMMVRSKQNAFVSRWYARFVSLLLWRRGAVTYTTNLQKCYISEGIEFAPIQIHPAKNENIISRDHNTNNPEKPLMGKRYPRVTDLLNFVFS